MAPGSGFDLLALRARCKREPTGWAGCPQGRRKGRACNLRKLPRAQRELAVPAACSKGSYQKFTEPVALSSTSPVNLRLPPTALGSGFDLLALRARCSEETTRSTHVRKDLFTCEMAHFASSKLSTFPRPLRGVGDKPVDGTHSPSTFHNACSRAFGSA